MPERLEAAFVFGSLGNLSEALGTGWSVEDNWAWAIGAESRLNLSLPSHAAHYIVRLTLQPLVNPGVLDAQRLSIETAAGKLASFSIDRRTTIELALPIEQTRDRSRIELILRHPDALRPSGFKKSDDSALAEPVFHVRHPRASVGRLVRAPSGSRAALPPYRRGGRFGAPDRRGDDRAAGVSAARCLPFRQHRPGSGRRSATDGGAAIGRGLLGAIRRQCRRRVAQVAAHAAGRLRPAALRIATDGRLVAVPRRRSAAGVRSGPVSRGAISVWRSHRCQPGIRCSCRTTSCNCPTRA